MPATADAARLSVSYPRTAIAGERVKVTVKLQAPRAGARLRLQRHTGSAWRTVAARTARRSGRTPLVWRPAARPGSARLRVIRLDGGRLTAVSRARRIWLASRAPEPTSGNQDATPLDCAFGCGGGGNPFPFGQCTYHAYERRPDVYNTAVAKGISRYGWDGYIWVDRARQAGFRTGRTPEMGALVSWSREGATTALGREHGHVAFVTAVLPGNRFRVTERNVRGPQVTEGTYAVTSRTTFAYRGGGVVDDDDTRDGSTTLPNLSGAGWQTAFQANDGSLWLVGGDNRGAMGLGMAPRTSPAITALKGGGWQTAFQANDGRLWVVGTDNRGALELGMRPGTSPSITGLSTGGWESAFQANDGRLWVVGADNRGALDLGMAPDTSPSIAGLADGGWQAAFQANDNSLWIVGKDNRGAMKLGMKPGSSPSIAALDGDGWQTAFQANTGELWVIGKDNRGAMGLGMAPGTSPSITGMVGGGWQAAFQSNTGELWVVGKDNRGSLRLGMKPGTSPSITGLAGGGWEVSFQANDGRLWVVGSDDRGALDLGMAGDSSPAITSYSPR